MTRIQGHRPAITTERNHGSNQHAQLAPPFYLHELQGMSMTVMMMVVMVEGRPQETQQGQGMLWKQQVSG